MQVDCGACGHCAVLASVSARHQTPSAWCGCTTKLLLAILYSKPAASSDGLADSKNPRKSDAPLTCHSTKLNGWDAPTTARPRTRGRRRSERLCTLCLPNKRTKVLCTLRTRRAHPRTIQPGTVSVSSFSSVSLSRARLSSQRQTVAANCSAQPRQVTSRGRCAAVCCTQVRAANPYAVRLRAHSQVFSGDRRALCHWGACPPPITASLPQPCNPGKPFLVVLLAVVMTNIEEDRMFFVNLML